MQVVNYKDFQPKETSRIRENIEWTITYSFNSLDEDSPRVLLIGDSICNQYHSGVRDRLQKAANISFWASSKCVTDKDYFRELEYILEQRPYSMITFNNGLHSCLTDFEEWKQAYTAVIDYIGAKLPEVRLSIVLSTPIATKYNASVEEQNAFLCEFAAKRGLPVLDLNTPAKGIPEEERWTDGVHFQPGAVAKLADCIAAHVRAELPDLSVDLVQKGSALGPDGAMQ